MSGFEGVQREKELPQPWILETGVMVDFTRHTLKYRDTLVKLTAAEKELFFFLARRPGAVLSFEKILKKMYVQEEYFPSDSKGVIKVKVSCIRKKLIEAARQTPMEIRTGASILKRHLQSQHGVGYRFEPNPFRVEK